MVSIWYVWYIDKGRLRYSDIRYSALGTGNHQGFSLDLPSARFVFGTFGFPRVITILNFGSKTKTKNSVRVWDELSAVY